MFWKYHKAILHHHSALNPVITFNNRTAKSPKEKAELFNTYFCAVFRPAKTITNSEESTSSPITSSQLSDITISEEEVTHHLSHLDPSKATGPDGIPGRILKECSSVIAPSLCSLFNHSLHSGTVPMNGNRPMLHPYIRRKRENPLSTTDQYLY